MNPEILSYNTPTSEEITKKIYQYEFKRLWKKNLDGNNKNLFFVISCLVIGSYTFISDDFVFTSFFAGVGLIAFSNYLTHLLSYRKSKKKIKRNN